jgi:hypothetical protein
MNMVMDSKEYAELLKAYGASFADFQAQWPNLAASEYGAEVKKYLAQ